jgi:hypothetical protein
MPGPRAPVVRKERALEELLKPILENPALILSRNLCVLFLGVLWLALIFWTYRDSRRRGSMALYWAAVVLFFNFFGWLIYLIVRPPEYADDVRERELEIAVKQAELERGDLLCPACAKPIDRDFLICPSCNKKLKKQCPKCEKPLKMEWNVCPYCREKL